MENLEFNFIVIVFVLPGMVGRFCCCTMLLLLFYGVIVIVFLYNIFVVV